MCENIRVETDDKIFTYEKNGVWTNIYDKKTGWNYCHDHPTKTATAIKYSLNANEYTKQHKIPYDPDTKSPSTNMLHFFK